MSSTGFRDCRIWVRWLSSSEVCLSPTFKPAIGYQLGHSMLFSCAAWLSFHPKINFLCPEILWTRPRGSCSSVGWVLSIEALTLCTVISGWPLVALSSPPHPDGLGGREDVFVAQRIYFFTESSGRCPVLYPQPSRCRRNASIRPSRLNGAL